MSVFDQLSQPQQSNAGSSSTVLAPSDNTRWFPSTIEKVVEQYHQMYLI